MAERILLNEVMMPLPYFTRIRHEDTGFEFLLKKSGFMV